MEIIQLILGLLFLTVVYNFGQLFFAIKSGIHNNHYFLGFNPKLLDFKVAGVNFSLGIYIPLFPFARLYKIEEGKKIRVSQPWEFTNFSLGKRLIVTLGGTFSLIISGIILLMIISYFEVEEYISKEEVNKQGIYPSELALKAGFQQGDKILKLNNEEYHSFNELINPQATTTYTVSRQGKSVEIQMTEAILNEYHSQHSHLLFYLNIPFKVGTVFPNSAAHLAGLQQGDRIIQVNGIPVFKNYELKDELLKSRNSEASIRIERQSDNTKIFLDTVVAVNEEGVIGFSPEEDIAYSKKETTLSEAPLKGLKKSWNVITSNIAALDKSVSPKPQTYTTTPIKIGSAYSGRIQWKKFWELTGALSLLIAMISLLPFPRAGFWDIIPLAYEAITKKTLSFKAYKTISRLGYVILGAFIVLSVINDFLRMLA